MSHDFLGDIINDAMQEKVVSLANEMIADGKSEDEVFAAIEKLDLSGMVIELISKASDDAMDDYKAHMYERVYEYELSETQFLAHIKLLWGKAFAASEAMYLITLEAATSFRKIIDERDPAERETWQYRFRVLLELHGRACQVFLEIIYLLKAGFPDGAYARWRSLYELTVIAQFIQQNEENVAQSFFSAWGQEKSDYEWARTAPCFQPPKWKEGRRISFEAIQQQCDFTSGAWHGQYGLSNKVVHASAHGTFGRLGTPLGQEVIAVGHSDFGLAIPGANAASMLAIISSIIFGFIFTGDGAWYRYTIAKWSKYVRDLYEDVEKAVLNTKETDKTDSEKAAIE